MSKTKHPSNRYERLVIAEKKKHKREHSIVKQRPETEDELPR